MKRFIIALVLCLLSFNVIADNYVPFSLDKSCGMSVGFANIYRTTGAECCGTKAGKTLITIGANLYCIYFEGAFNSVDTGHSVYGYKECIYTTLFKIGPSFVVKYNDNLFSFKPYGGWMGSNVSDTSGNSIGAHTDYGKIGKNIGIVGIKFCYTYKWIEFGADISNATIGGSLGFNIDFL